MQIKRSQRFGILAVATAKFAFSATGELRFDAALCSMSGPVRPCIAPSC
jgi:hypothetical protein